MGKSRKAHAIIPARYASTRFPGKPLVLLHGKPMFWHVWSRASRSPLLETVTLATDDERIAAAANELGVPCVMTANDHKSGTDRVFETARKLAIPEQDIVINIQGDEPALNPACLDQLIECFADSSVQVATLARNITKEEASSPDTVKVVLAANDNALYFSRAAIPYDRDTHGVSGQVLGHMGIYAFTFSALQVFVTLPESFLERTERLEQLRLLENAIAIRVVKTAFVSPGVDHPDDIARVLPLL